MTSPRFTGVVLTALALLAAALIAQTPAPSDFTGYRTPATAVTTKIVKAAAADAAPRPAGYLGIHVVVENDRLLIASVALGSPAAKAGLKAREILRAIDGRTMQTPADVRDAVQSRAAGDTLALTLERAGKPAELHVTLDPVSRPLKLEAPPVTIGARLGSGAELEGTPVEALTINGPAQKAGVKIGDLVMKVDGVAVTEAAMLTAAITPRKPGDIITLHIRRTSEELDIPVTLAPERTTTVSPTGNTVFSGKNIFRKPVYKLAVIGIEYPDVKHNPDIPASAWHEAIFSRDSYRDKNNPTGQPVYGSVADYYQELSGGKIKIEGKVFDWIEVSKNRADYSQGSGVSNKTAVMIEALDKLIERDGEDALKDFDGIFFIYAGDRYKAVRGGVYWPHRSRLTHKGVQRSYLIIPEGGARMTNISVMCHEFGHMLGLPDQYARPELPGSEGASVWCAMSNQLPGGRPQHFCAWCKEQLGWLKPAVIDPKVPQKLVLGPVEGSATEAFKVLMRPDGSEYLLLENRRKKGWDVEMPAEGLLIWRVTGNKPLLEESHGIEGPAGPSAFRSYVPYPSASNNAYTPYTTPSSRSTLGGSAPVHITNIRQLPDGHISFEIGYEYQ